jgi:hypothetical protein
MTKILKAAIAYFLRMNLERCKKNIAKAIEYYNGACGLVLQTGCKTY